MPARFARQAVAVSAGLALALTSAAHPAAAGAHRAAPKITSIAAPAPKGAATDPQLRLNDVTCPAAGNCCAVGTYNAANGAHLGVLEHLSGGTWHAQTAPSPIFADSDPKTTLSVITCASAHFCVAFGTYVDATDSPARKQGLLETFQRETPDAPLVWSGSRLFATPGGATVARIVAASCSPDRTCAAVGSYLSGGVRHAQLETYGSGGWTAGDAPFDGNSLVSSALSAVDCPAEDLCSAAGYYTDAYGAQVGLLERLEPSGWSQEAVASPAGADPHPDLRLRAIDCPGVDACLAGGRFTTTSARERGVLETRALGAWSPRTAPVPSGSATDPAMVLTGLTCAGAGSCAATSERTDAAGHQVGALLTLTDGKWHASAAPLPHAAPNPHVVLADLACGHVAVGSYADDGGHTRPLLETFAHGAWTGRRGPLPLHAGAAAAGLAAVACDPGGAAVAVGRYVDDHGRHRGLVTVNVPA